MSGLAKPVFPFSVSGVGVADRYKFRMVEWMVPLVFMACASWVIWNGPAYIIAAGWGDDALRTRYDTAGILDFLFLIAVPVTAVIGVRTIGVASMEYQDVRGMDKFSMFLGRVTMFAVVLLVAVMSYEVVLRYVFERPTLWANELSLWIAAFIFLLAGLYAMQQRSHIRIFILYDVLPRWVQKLCDVISTALIAVFAMGLVYGGYGEAKAKFLRWETFGTAFDPPIPATEKPIILLVVCLVTLQAISNLINDWNKAPEHHSADDIDEEEIEALRKTLEGGK